MPSKHISSITGDTEQHVSYHFDTIQEMIEFERFLQESTFEKYQQDQEISFDVAEAAIKKSLVLPENNVEIVSCEIESRPWIVDWKKVEEEIGPEYKWFAADEDGLMGLYTGRPKIEDYDEGGAISILALMIARIRLVVNTSSKKALFLGMNLL